MSTNQDQGKPQETPPSQGSASKAVPRFRVLKPLELHIGATGLGGQIVTEDQLKAAIAERFRTGQLASEATIPELLADGVIERVNDRTPV